MLDCFQINCISEGLKKSKTCRDSALVEAGAAQDTGSCMPPMLKMPYHKREGSLFTSALLHYFTLVKVKEVCLTGWAFLHLVIFYSSHLKMVCE